MIVKDVKMKSKDFTITFPELARLWWDMSARPMVESIDRFFWENIATEKRSRQQDQWNQSIFDTKWADEYGFTGFRVSR